ncbi:hypothetical protein ACJMK2_039806 [Sinanodonta woodiana]|uniref:Uncharacterized protein n=1 Tax=Sinanodonta woodiana TaxID=1069815 RepID=A0ABD3WD42_SINWO
MQYFRDYFASLHCEKENFERILDIKSTVIHTDIIVTECGLWVHEEYPCLGSNPNGLLTCKLCVESIELIQVKCPFTFGNMIPFEAAKDPSFCCEFKGLSINNVTNL